jgi:deoxyguanosine kinase
LAEKIPKPDLILYLRATPSTLMQRISLRDRSYERSMEREYIELLHHTYEKFFKQRDDIPVLTIDTDHLDYLQRADDLVWIENRIRQALRMAPFQPELPLLKGDT